MNHSGIYQQTQQVPYPMDLLSPVESTQKQLPYPTMPYPGFTNYQETNQSTDSLTMIINNKELRYKQFGDVVEPRSGLISGGQRMNSMSSLDSGFPVQPAPQLQTQQPQKYQHGYQRHDVAVDELQEQFVAKLTVEEYPESVQRFNRMKELSVKDYSNALGFNPQIQLDWVELLLEYTADVEFLRNYNINGERLEKPLSPQEIKKNEHIFIKQAIKLLKKIASEAKSANAQFLLGSLYSNSPVIKIGRINILEKNYEKSFDYYHKAALQSHDLALYRLAVSYELGIGTSVNESKALDCFIKSANLGCVPSMFKLGVIYSRGGLKTIRSAKHSVYWFEKASEFASAENPHALFELAKICERDLPFLRGTPSEADWEYLKELDQLGFTKDDKKAVEYYKEAARFKYPAAQFKLGWAYEYGKLNCTIDAKKSIGWYSRSASQTYPAAEMALSGWYLTGAKGILEPNDKEAFLWASKAAQSGFVKAQYAMGYYYEVGLGCQADLELSRKFYVRAATQGHEKAVEKLREFRK